MTPKIDLGIIQSVNPDYINASGDNVPVVNVQSLLDGKSMPVPWLPIGAQQYQPETGQGVIFIRLGDFGHRILTFIGLNPAYIRKGQFGLNAGEVVVQSDSGLGYAKFSSDGRVELVTGDTTCHLEGSTAGWSFTSASVNMQTYGKTAFAINAYGSFSVVRTISSDGTPGSVSGTVTIGFDANGNVTISTPADLTLLGKQIFIDGQIWLGPGASVESNRVNSGPAVTTGPVGSYPFDFMSGNPIPGVSKVNIMA